MIRLSITIALIISSVVTNALSAQESLQFETLEETIYYAIENNNNLESAMIDQEIIEAQIAEVNGRALPQIRRSVNFVNNYLGQVNRLTTNSSFY